MNYKEIFEAMIANNTSDIFVREHSPLRGRVYTEIKTINDYVFKRGDIDRVINDITDDDQKESLRKNRSCEFAIRAPGTAIRNVARTGSAASQMTQE